MPTVFGIVQTTTNRGRGWHSQLFCSGPRTGAGGENVSPFTTGLQKKSIMVGRCRRAKTFVSLFFLNLPVAGTPRHVRKNFTQKFEDLSA